MPHARIKVQHLQTTVRSMQVITAVILYRYVRRTAADLLGGRYSLTAFQVASLSKVDTTRSPKYGASYLVRLISQSQSGCGSLNFFQQDADQQNLVSKTTKKKAASQGKLARHDASLLFHPFDISVSEWMCYSKISNNTEYSVQSPPKFGVRTRCFPRQAQSTRPRDLLFSRL